MATDAGVRPCVFVVGAGRSGTSLVSMVLQRLGFVVPPPEVPPDETNPRGFAESQWTVDFHDALLERAAVQAADSRPDAARRAMEAVTPEDAAAARSWLMEHDAGRGLLVKDPRTALFLPLWREALAAVGMTPGYVLMLRAPHEVAMSHSRYYGDGREAARFLGSWVSTMLTAERQTRGSARAFVRFEDLLARPEQTVAAAAALLPGVGPVDPHELAAAVTVVDPALRRVDVSWDDVEAPIGAVQIARELWDALSAQAAGADVSERLDALADEWRTYYGLAEAVVGSATTAAVVHARRDASGLRATARRLPGQILRRVRIRSRHARTAD